MERNEKFRPFLRVLDKESKEKNSWGEKRTRGRRSFEKLCRAKKKKKAKRRTNLLKQKHK